MLVVLTVYQPNFFFFFGVISFPVARNPTRCSRISFLNNDGTFREVAEIPADASIHASYPDANNFFGLGVATVGDIDGKALLLLFGGRPAGRRSC